MAIEAFAPAKINLTLHVTGQRSNGYHLLDSLVVFADVGDRLWLSEAAEMRLNVTGPFAEGVPDDASNLVWRAAECAGWAGHIRLEKNLPHGAGIGGGSSDAAAVLRYFEAPEYATWLGADVQVCLWPGVQRMRGVGDHLDRIGHIPECHLVLVNTGVAVPTPQVFDGLSDKTNPPMEAVPSFADYAAFVDWLSAQRNDLQSPAISIAPSISEALAAVSDADVSRMSGSGSTVFGVYSERSLALEVAQRIVSEHPQWWVVATCLTE